MTARSHTRQRRREKRKEAERLRRVAARHGTTPSPPRTDETHQEHTR